MLRLVWETDESEAAKAGPLDPYDVYRGRRRRRLKIVAVIFEDGERANLKSEAELLKHLHTAADFDSLAKLQSGFDPLWLLRKQIHITREMRRERAAAPRRKEITASSIRQKQEEFRRRYPKRRGRGMTKWVASELGCSEETIRNRTK